MSLLRAIASGLRSLFWKKRAGRELDEELRGFLEMAAEEKMNQGMTRHAAARAVRLERGSLELFKEVVRDSGWESSLETCWRDLRFGFRMLRKNPGVTSTVALTLALGIGVNTGVFSLLNGWLLRPLPISARLSVVAVHESYGKIITESLLMALLGSAGGFLFGGAALNVSGSLLHSVFTNGNNRGFSMDVSFDWRVFAYATGTAILAGILVGPWPALRATRTDVNAELQEGSRGASPSGGKSTVRSILTVALACSLILLIAAGLFVRSLNSTEHTYLGFNPDHVLNVIMDPHEIGYDQAQTKAFYEELGNEVGRIPGVQSTRMAFTVPMGRPSNTTPIFVQSHPVAPHERPPVIPYDCISPSYLETMQVPLIKGRQFIDADREGAPAVAIVNHAMAKRFWPNEDPIGKHFSLNSNTGPFVEVVGVAGDGQYFFISRSPQPYFYLPLAQKFVSYRFLQLRTSVPPESLVRSVEEQVHRLAPDLPIDDIRTTQQLVQGIGGLFLFRLAATAAAVMGFLGLVLAIVGVYGVISYSVSQRTNEIGIRMALGAGSDDILKLVSAQGLRLVGFGVAVGLVAAWALSRAMKSLLVGVNAADPITFVTVAVLLTLVALAACLVPALRATRVDPMLALRYE